jgi:hypothetical protein
MGQSRVIVEICVQELLIERKLHFQAVVQVVIQRAALDLSIQNVSTTRFLAIDEVAVDSGDRRSLILLWRPEADQRTLCAHPLHLRLIFKKLDHGRLRLISHRGRLPDLDPLERTFDTKTDEEVVGPS